VSESAELLRMLRRIRRRARMLAAVEVAVAGAALGLAALALGAVASRARGGVISWRVGATATGALALLGAGLGAARRISLPRCARLLDAAMDRGGNPGDRALSALSFTEGHDTPLARAALADAVTRARALAPAFVAPTRRPRALPTLGGATLALLIAGAWPARAPGARRDAGRPLAMTVAEPRLRVAGEALEAERAELAAAATAAEVAGDVSLMALAREARATLDALGEGALGRGEALDRLKALAARAKEAADETDAARAALRAVGKALEPTTATRALGRALGADDPEATERALDDLAARAAAPEGAGARADLASALGAAASGIASGAAAGEDGAGPGDGRRRLNRERETAAAGAPAGGGADPGARRLERLRRDLEETAAACRGDAAACANRLHDGAAELPSAAREAREASARRGLENAVRQLRERLRRGDLDDGARGATERRFARVARGETRPSSGSAERGGGEGQEAIASEGPATANGEDSEEVFTDEPAGQGDDAASARAGAGAAEGASADGTGAATGAGHEAGGDALGRAGATPPTRGREHEVHVRDGAGPTRSEIIEASAQRGFSARDYVRVFDDYQPVVEESLAAAAVPEGRRYVVRRYFQLIRPRAVTPGRAAPRRP
jgi:hypothetical protein